MFFVSLGLIWMNSPAKWQRKTSKYPSQLGFPDSGRRGEATPLTTPNIPTQQRVSVHGAGARASADKRNGREDLQEEVLSSTTLPPLPAPREVVVSTFTPLLLKTDCVIALKLSCVTNEMQPDSLILPFSKNASS